MNIIDRRAQFATTEASRAPELLEIATTQDGRDITRGYVEALPLLPPQDTVLAGVGGSYETYQEVLRDDQVGSTFAQRRLAVVSKEWEVLPGGTKRQDKRAADFLAETLGRISWDSITDKMLHGLFYGYAVGECLWARDGGQVALEAIKVRKQRRFGFAPDGSLRLLTMAHPVDGEPVPPKKFWAYAVGTDNDDEPYGLGLAHWLYWPVHFKRSDLKFWLIFLDKFGMPTVKGHYPQSASDGEKTKLLRTLEAIQTDSGIILPEGFDVGLIEGARAGTAHYAELYDRMNGAISKIVVGQTMTTDDGSSRSQAQVHWEVRQDLVRADADLVCSSFNRGPATWLTEWNFPGAAIPKVWRRIEDEPDLKPQAERDKLVFEMGYRPTLKHITETYGGEWEPIASPSAPSPEPGPPAAAPPTFAEPRADTASRYAEQLDREAMGAMDGLIAPIRELVEQAGSLEELSDRLLEAYGQMPVDQLGALMQQTLTAAELAGRFEAQTGA